MTKSLTAEYFESVYAVSDDPWNFASSQYEDSKYRNTLDALPRPFYTNALEIGCSIGVFTYRLALRCATLLATDVSTRALAAARERCKALGHVRFEQSKLPAEYPTGRFDLTVLSEVGYYWSAEDLGHVTRQIVDHMAPGGHLILVHWIQFVENYPLSGDEVHDYFFRMKRLRHVQEYRNEHYRMDLFCFYEQPAAN